MFPSPPPIAGGSPTSAPGSAAPTADATGQRGPPIFHRGQPVERILLPDRLTLGRTDENDVVLASRSVSRHHANIQRVPNGGFEVTDLHSRAGSLANGRRFETHSLVINDQLQIGPFCFRFDGTGLERSGGLTGVEIEARHVTKRAGTLTILDDVSVRVERGSFAAILGPSGSGKSSLLDVLTGLRPGQGGQVLFDGADFYRNYDELRSLLGYVPQDDIVHTELTVVEALRFSARLRLPAGTPRFESEKLVAQTMEQLGLTPRSGTPIARLSGGQRKRVSVGVELLGGPSVLFLDEPTSGLDPATEAKMMALLRDLARGACTVICTTHVMENVYLTDRIFIVAAGRLVFAGNSEQTRSHFGIRALTELYDRLEERPVEEWQARFAQSTLAADGANTFPSPTAVDVLPAPQRPRFKAQRGKSNLGTLLHRQWAILASDRKNFLILFGQSLLIALLTAWVAREPNVEAFPRASLSLFFAYLATLWFGTSNAAQEIVRELPIYRRERMVGLGRHTYLLSKFIFVGAMTVAQGIFLYGCLWLLEGRILIGSAPWQLTSLACTALAGVGIGFAISALCRTAMQAVMVVPLVLIPQILFSGFVVPADEMTNAVLFPTRLVPSYAAQTLMDQSIFWQRKIEVDQGEEEVFQKYRSALNNLELQLNPGIKLAAGGFDRSVEKVLHLSQNDDPPIVYHEAGPGIWAAGKLLLWMALGYTTAWFGVRSKERG